MKRVWVFAPWLVLATACASAVGVPESGDAAVSDAASSPDAAPPLVDGGAESVQLESFGVAPAAGEAASEHYQVRGHLRASTRGVASSGQYRVRGGMSSVAP